MKYPNFIAVGESGNDIVMKIIAKLPKSEKSDIRTYSVQTGKKGKTIQELLIDYADDRPFLICDSIVNTGKTMNYIREHLLGHAAKDVMTLTVILRNGSKLIPNFYAMMCDKNDEIFFGRKSYPICFYFSGTIRQIDDRDSGKKINSGVEWIDRNIDDYLYIDVIDPSYHTYLIENEMGTVVGILHFNERKDKSIFLDTLAIDKNSHGKGYGSSLLAFLEDYCKFNDIHRVIMLARFEKVSYYKQFGYNETGKIYNFTSYGVLIEMETTFIFNV